MATLTTNIETTNIETTNIETTTRGRFIGSKGTFSVWSNDEGTFVYDNDTVIESGYFEWESNAWWFFSYTKAFDEVEDILNYFNPSNEPVKKFVRK